MKNTIIIICLLFSACGPKPASLEEQKAFLLESIKRDEWFLKQATESGLLEKIESAQTKDSFYYYQNLFFSYSDSIRVVNDSVNEKNTVK